MKAAEDSLPISNEMEARNGTPLVRVAEMGHESEITEMGRG